MTPRLRTIRTRRRATSVPRKEIRAAVKAVMATRTPEIERLVRGEPIRRKAEGAARK
jgi:hypothetical protein